MLTCSVFSVCILRSRFTENTCAGPLHTILRSLESFAQDSRVAVFSCVVCFGTMSDDVVALDKQTSGACAAVGKCVLITIFFLTRFLLWLCIICCLGLRFLQVKLD